MKALDDDSDEVVEDAALALGLLVWGVAALVRLREHAVCGG